MHAFVCIRAWILTFQSFVTASFLSGFSISSKFSGRFLSSRFLSPPISDVHTYFPSLFCRTENPTPQDLMAVTALSRWVEVHCQSCLSVNIYCAFYFSCLSVQISCKVIKQGFTHFLIPHPNLASRR